MDTNTSAAKNSCSVYNTVVKRGELSYQCSKCAGLTHSSCCPDIDKTQLTGFQCQICALSEQAGLSNQSTPSSASSTKHRKRSALSPPELSSSRLKIRPVSIDSNSQSLVELNMSQSFDAEAEKFQNDPTVPVHLKKLGSLFQSSHSSLQSQLNTIDNRMTANEAENARALANLRADIISTRTQVDSCEVRFSGIPSSVALSDPDVINAILHAIDCADRVGTILSIRRWPAQPAHPRLQPQAPEASSALGNGRPVQDSTNKIALVAKFCSPTVRDFVISKLILDINLLRLKASYFRAKCHRL
ncbi:hypothetical protein QAD02_010259 [Eretmocerus hayati]|uniref:Uncharacterized protein n=1 Tax=Eretmocerus hayati TaxID=131215 RepID=A0ACC2NCD3_9HYME|nr:hypothetical protein QAD02_010259 [Eretmocerus hayati]